MPGDTSRVEVAQALAEQFGAPVSAALMEVIPPFGWHEIATREDLGRLEQKMDARFDALTAEFNARFATIDARFATIDARFLAVDARFDGLESKLTAAFRAETTRLVRWMVGAVIATVAAGAALVSAVAALQ